MANAQHRNDEMAALLTADLLTTVDRNLCAEFYNSATGTTFSTIATAAPLNTTRLNLATTRFLLGSNEVFITRPGIYQVAYHVTIGHATGSSNAVAACWLEQAPAAGAYAEVPATKTFVVMHGASWGSGQAASILRVSESSKFRIMAQRDMGSDTLWFLAQGVRLSAALLVPMP